MGILVQWKTVMFDGNNSGLKGFTREYTMIGRISLRPPIAAFLHFYARAPRVKGNFFTRVIKVLLEVSWDVSWHPWATTESSQRMFLRFFPKKEATARRVARDRF